MKNQNYSNHHRFVPGYHYFTLTGILVLLIGAIVNLVKLVPYTWLGQFSSSNLLMSLLLAPLAPIGISMGYYLHHRINEKSFFSVIYLSLVVVGIKLIFDGWQAN